MTQEEVTRAIQASACFRAESAYLARGGIEVRPAPRLFKFLENDLVRASFPTTVRIVDEGTVIALVTLFDLRESACVYAHVICAGPSASALLKAVYSPLSQAKPQPGIEGDKAIAKFIAWKQAAWTRFLNDELEQGPEAASAAWMASFWKAMDRMYGGGTLQD